MTESKDTEKNEALGCSEALGWSLREMELSSKSPIAGSMYLVKGGRRYGDVETIYEEGDCMRAKTNFDLNVWSCDFVSVEILSLEVDIWRRCCV